MPSKTPLISAAGAVAALAGGLASAIMVAAAAKHLAFDGKLLAPLPAQKMLPAMLAFLTPLPLMLTTVGFGSIAGAIAVVVGAAAFGALAPLLVSGALADPQTLTRMALRGLGFAFAFGGPALLLGGLARPPAPKRGADSAADPAKGRLEERLIGRVLAVAIAVSAILVGVGAVLVIQTKGGYAAAFQELTKQIQPLLAADPATKQVNPAWIARLAIWFGGLWLAAQAVCLFSLNLWIAGRVAQTSGLLAQPWPSLPRYLRVPTPLAILAAIAFGLSFAGGLFGLVSVIVAGAITAGFAFQGLAVVHQLTRGSSWRMPILFSIYLALGILPPLMLIFAAAGLCDAAFFFRDRERIVIRKKGGLKPPDRKNDGPWS